ncbi:MAG: hypothetical protein M1812_006630 [Candelaria pacifica]|nr:MAG: hypothetical protein M1812_006630 [Candelaria pacifica]
MAQRHVRCNHTGHTKIVAPCVWDYDEEHLTCPNGDFRIISWVPCHVPPLCPSCYRGQDDAIRAFHGALIGELQVGRLIWSPWELGTNLVDWDTAFAHASNPSGTAETSTNENDASQDTVDSTDNNDVEMSDSSDGEVSESSDGEGRGVPLPANASSPVNGTHASTDWADEDGNSTDQNENNDSGSATPNGVQIRYTVPSPPSRAPSDSASITAGDESSSGSGPGSASSSVQEYEASQETLQVLMIGALLQQFWLKRFAALARVNLQHKWLDEPRRTWTVEDEQRVRDGALEIFREDMGVFGDG